MSVEADVETMALAHLEILRKSGRYLFQGDRRPGPIPVLHPATVLSRIEPHRVQGIWVSEVGLMPPIPLVKNLFASPVAAALCTVTTNQGNERCAAQLQAFSDQVVAMTFGDNATIRGQVEALLERGDTLDDEAPMEDCFVNVVLRSELPSNRLSFPLPGEYVSTEPVRVVERVSLTAGDLRALGRVLAEVPRPWMDDLANSCAPAFCGPFAAGGHLQFDSVTGELLRKRRRPLDSDRRAARLHAQSLAENWLKRWWAPMQRASRLALRETAFDRVLRFVDAHCSDPLTVDALAAEAGTSRGHLNLLFRRHVGMSPMAYVAQKRLDLAERLLTETRLSVSEVAERCGFAEQSSLNHCLKRLRGTTPSALRGS